MRFLLSLGLILTGFLLFAQSPITISGTLTDAQNGETLIGATIQLAGTTKGTITNEYGYYALSLLPTDSVTLSFSFVGFVPQNRRIAAKTNQTINIALGTGGTELREVVIEANGIKERLASTQMSVATLDVREAKLLPALLGEVDILKTLQLKPGINAGSEGNSALYVRGGGGDQNLIVLDEAVVYNANHLFGFFSTFNSDAVKDVKVFKGGFPAQYGGRLSSVIDVRMKDGNNKKFSGSGGIGLIATRLTLEGPLDKAGRGSFIVSGRRTYADIFLNLYNKSQEGKADFTPIPGYYFYDLNAKANYLISDRDRIYVSGYFGRDVFAFDGGFFDFNFNWGNATGTTRWNHVFGPRLFSNTTLTFSDYKYEITNKFSGFSFSLGSRIRDANLKVDFNWAAAENHKVRFGFGATQHWFTVGRLKAGSSDGKIAFESGKDYDGIEMGAYINDEWTISDKFKLDYGLRISGFSNDTFYYGLEPRLAANYRLNSNVSLRASYARMYQYVHLVSNSSVSLPTDVWYPSTPGVRPQRSDQVAAGWSIGIGKQWYFNNEYYYKWLNNQLDFIDHAELFANNTLETQFAFGDGYALGAEFELEKREGKLTGWIGYTLGYIQRGNFANIMQGRYYSPRHDRRHNITVVGIYELTPKWTISSAWVFGSGDKIWLPSGRFAYQDLPGASLQPVVSVYGDRNNINMPAYHRLDIGIVRKFKHKWGTSDLTFSAYNAYNRRNPYFLFLEPEFQTVEIAPGQTIELPNRVAAKQVSLFPIIPTFTWNFAF